MIKVLERSEIQGAYLNIIKAIYSKPIDNIKWRETQGNSSKIRNRKKKLSILAISIP